MLEAWTPAAPRELAQNKTVEQQLAELRASVIVRRPGERLKRCFLCVAKAMSILQKDTQYPTITGLCREFTATSGLSRHFKAVHLRRLVDNEGYTCPICHVHMKRKGHMENHANAFHGIPVEKISEASYREAMYKTSITYELTAVTKR